MKYVSSWTWLVLVAMLDCMFIGCHTDSSPTGKTDQNQVGGGKHIGISYIASDNPFFPTIVKQVQTFLEPKGYVVRAFDAENNHERQVSQVDDFIKDKVDAILLIPCNSKLIGSSVRKANQADIPVFTADVAVLDPGANVVCHVATDNYGGGKLAAHQILDAVRHKGKVAVIDYPDIESVQLRLKGFREVLSYANNEGAAVDLVDVLPAFGKREVAERMTLKLLDDHPDITAIFAVNDPIAFGTLDAIRKKKMLRKIKVVGFDGSTEAKQMVLDGIIHADIIQFPKEIGTQIAVAIDTSLFGKQTPSLMLIPTAAYTNNGTKSLQNKGGPPPTSDK